MRKAKDDTSRHADVGNVEKKEPDFPNISAMRAQNHEHHVERGMEAGLTREQAERHAKDDGKHWSPKHVEEAPHED